MNSYSSIFQLGHRYLKDLLSGPVNVEEKVDGSQLSFSLCADGELRMRSKGADIYTEAPEGMFRLAVVTVKSLKDTLTPGWTYRGEFLAKPKHNALAYDRTPKGNIILFDIERGDYCDFLSYEEKAVEAARIGLECVPLFFSGELKDLEQFRQFLDKESILGGQKIEGVVIKPKNYDLFGLDKKLLIGKFVSEHFKEVHKAAWGESNPNHKDIISLLGTQYKSAARWQKALIHLQEKGILENSPKDIGLLIREIPADIKKEAEEEIKEQLFKWAWPQVARIATAGFPEWYKELLLKRSFENEETVDDTRLGNSAADSANDSESCDVAVESK